MQTSHDLGKYRLHARACHDEQFPAWFEHAGGFSESTGILPRECAVGHKLKIDLAKDPARERRSGNISLYVRPGSGSDIQGDIVCSQSGKARPPATPHNQPRSAPRGIRHPSARILEHVFAISHDFIDYLFLYRLRLTRQSRIQRGF